MTDPTRRDIRLGDLSSLDSTGVAAREPRLGSTDTGADTTRSGRRVELPPEEPPVRTQPRMPAVPGTTPGPFSWPVVVLCILVLVLAAVVVMLVLEQRDTARALAALDAKARESVQTLESRVASTSTTMKSADSETQRSLNLIANDIGRLNEGLTRLARALEDEAKARTAVDTELKVVATEMRKATQAGAQVDAQLEAKLDTRVKSATDSIEQLAARQKTLADSIARLERNGDAAQLRAEVAVLGASIRQLQDDHEKRLKATEQAAGSNDAFRRQVNATIDRLNQQVSELYQRR